MCSEEEKTPTIVTDYKLGWKGLTLPVIPHCDKNNQEISKGFHLPCGETVNVFLIQKYVDGQFRKQYDLCIAVAKGLLREYLPEVAPCSISRPIHRSHKELPRIISHHHFPMKLEKYQCGHVCYKKRIRKKVKNSCKQCQVTLCLWLLRGLSYKEVTEVTQWTIFTYVYVIYFISYMYLYVYGIFLCMELCNSQ